VLGGNESPWHKDMEMLLVLLENGFNANIGDDISKTALHWAALKRDIEVIVLLLDHGANVNVQDGHGYTATVLLWAMHYGCNKKLIMVLLDRGDNLNIETKWKQTLCEQIFSKGNREIAELVLKHSALINRKDCTGWKFVHWVAYRTASGYNRKQIVSLLIENEDNINIKERCGHTALDMVISFEQKMLIKFLREKGTEERRVEALEKVILQEKGA
jgi:ankyrin repeat protein